MMMITLRELLLLLLIIIITSDNTNQIGIKEAILSKTMSLWSASVKNTSKSKNNQISFFLVKPSAQYATKNQSVLKELEQTHSYLCVTTVFASAASNRVSNSS